MVVMAVATVAAMVAVVMEAAAVNNLALKQTFSFLLSLRKQGEFFLPKF
jgi:hypothetical protein